jgi:hypothetical protein
LVTTMLSSSQGSVNMNMGHSSSPHRATWRPSCSHVVALEPVETLLDAGSNLYLRCIGKNSALVDAMFQ